MLCRLSHHFQRWYMKKRFISCPICYLIMLLRCATAAYEQLPALVDRVLNMTFDALPLQRAVLRAHNILGVEGIAVLHIFQGLDHGIGARVELALRHQEPCEDRAALPRMEANRCAHGASNMC